MKSRGCCTRASSACFCAELKSGHFLVSALLSPLISKSNRPMPGRILLSLCGFFEVGGLKTMSAGSLLILRLGFL